MKTKRKETNEIKQNKKYCEIHRETNTQHSKHFTQLTYIR